MQSVGNIIYMKDTPIDEFMMPNCLWKVWSIKYYNNIWSMKYLRYILYGRMCNEINNTDGTDMRLKK